MALAKLHLLIDPWIPVLDTAGMRRIIAPWQMADPALVRPDWPRADLNLACLEFLIGLVFLADPPEDAEDWEDRADPDPDRLRARLEPFAPAFNLTGEGPLFLQDLDPLPGEANPPDMLFIDSAGAQTAKNNADLMVRRGRYPSLDPALAAMALYAFQAHAPSGGAGNRTSMRGGGPMVTLVDPGAGLWSLVWANVPDGRPGAMGDLPWMRRTVVSDTGDVVLPPDGRVFGVEAFFGMPRRLRLVEAEGWITGVIQRPYGTNYAKWMHPLTPHYRMKAGEEWLPKHPRAGHFGYRNWLGVLADERGGNTECALVLRQWRARGRGGHVRVAGWAMDNMKPRDFILSQQPVVELPSEAADRLLGMIAAAEQAGVALRGALEPVLAGGETREAEREAFFIATEDPFRIRFDALKAGADPGAVAAAWLGDLRAQAMRQFEALALPGLPARETDAIARIVQARGYLAAAFKGYGKQGGAMFDALGLDKPARKGRAA
ncbi:MAG: type I-E CRISPR-associated protein Cse1/CasA [Rhodobacteraceae bacterium]|nr:type I-E CRISPR-associated protein Cse1/CasA [Paracoccaceae bacterium]